MRVIITTKVWQANAQEADSAVGIKPRLTLKGRNGLQRVMVPWDGCGYLSDANAEI